MSGRTIAIGDVHGDLAALERLLGRLPSLDDGDTVVFIGDYVDRGADSAGVVARVRRLAADGPARVVALRGNHEDAWLHVIDDGWIEFLLPRGNGCFECLRSFQGGAMPAHDDAPGRDDFIAMERGGFFPADVVAWLRALPYFYEDDQDKVVNVLGNKAVITLTGTCEQVNISGNKAIVKGTTARVQISGNENKLALDAADAISVSGNKNIVSCKKGLRDAPPRVLNSGTNNKVSVEK